MDRNLTIKILGWIAVLLLFAPMYRQCNGVKNNEEKPAEEIAPAEEVLPIGDSLTTKEIDSLKRINAIAPPVECPPYVEPERSSLEILSDYAINPLQDNSGSNAYEMSWIFSYGCYQMVAETKEFVKEYRGYSNEKKIIFHCLYIRCFSFLIIVIQAWLFAIFLSRRPKFAKRLFASNLIFLLVASVVTFFDPWFETWDQIRWGFYVFVTVQVALFFLLKNRMMKV